MTVGILIGLFAVLLLTKQHKTPTGKKSARRAALRARARPVNPYASASVHRGASACAQVQELGDKRFLSAEAPQLPLATCSQERCSCRYRRHPERRREDDRRDLCSMQANLYSVSGDADRRLRSRGRRATDVADSQAVEEIDYDNIEWTT
jgi:hypothetical protein